MLHIGPLMPAPHQMAKVSMWMKSITEHLAEPEIIHSGCWGERNKTLHLLSMMWHLGKRVYVFGLVSLTLLAAFVWGQIVQACPFVFRMSPPSCGEWLINGALMYTQ